MKNFMKHCGLFALILMLIFTSCDNISAATDTEGPTVDICTLSVDKTEVEPNEQVKISYKVTDESEIASYSCGITLGNGSGPGYGIQYDKETGICTFDYMPNYSGLAEIVDIVVEDAYGNRTRYVNSEHSHYGEYGYNWDDASAIKCDLSAANFMVKGLNVDDVAGPTIDLESLTKQK